MKIFVSQFGHETNTFAADRTDAARFAQAGWFTGENIVHFKNGTNYMSGILRKAEESGVELVHGLSVFNVGGLVLSETYEQIKQIILNALTSAKDDIDGICLSLHGAAVSENIDDLETDLVRSIRNIMGRDMPIAACFDLHGNITNELCELLDGVVCVKEYPHIDCAEAGAKALGIVINAARQKTRPAVAYRRIPLLIPCAKGCTFESPASDIKEYLAELKKSSGVIDISFFHGFPYADLPFTGASVAVTDYDKQLALEVAEKAAQYIWNRRQEFIADYLSAKEAVDKALQLPGMPIVINETSDNPGGGTPADGTHLLRELIERNVPKSCFGYIYDPEFVNLAERAGVGNNVSGLLGGKTDTIHGEPIEVKDAYIKIISDGRFVTSNPVFNKGSNFNIGKSVLIKIGNVDVIVGSLRFQTPDDRLFALFGINVREYKIVALKSTHHFRAVFDNIAREIVTADPPGIQTANFSLLPYQRISRPVYPLNDNIDY